MSDTKYISFADLWLVEKEKNSVKDVPNEKKQNTIMRAIARSGDRHTTECKQLNIRITHKTFDKIKAFCKKEDLSLQEFIEIASEYYMQSMLIEDNNLE